MTVCPPPWLFLSYHQSHVPLLLSCAQMVSPKFGPRMVQGWRQYCLMINLFSISITEKRLFFKFHGPLLSTFSSWYLELNLNCRIFSPTSTILILEPIFYANLGVFLKACWFCWRSANSYPNKLSSHSSSKSGVLLDDIIISSSSSFMSCKFFRLSTIVCSISLGTIEMRYLTRKEKKER